MIAFDNAKLMDRPVVWNMHKVLTISITLGVLGVFSSFGLFWIGEEVLHLDRATVQTLMFLKLTVAGHMTIYLTRAGEHHFWVKPFPSAKLFWMCEITQVVATFFCRVWHLYDPHRMEAGRPYLGLCSRLVCVQRFRQSQSLSSDYSSDSS